MLPTMRAEISVAMPRDATAEHYREWLEFWLNQRDECSRGNPLRSQIPQPGAIAVTVNGGR